MHYLIDSLDVGACLAVLVAVHLLVLAVVLGRTHRAAVSHQTPARSGGVTVVLNGVSETQWRDGWIRQLVLWAGVFSIAPGVGYLLLVWLVVSRWVPQHRWVVPVTVVAFLLAAGGGVGWWLWRRHARRVPAVEPYVTVVAPHDPIPHERTPVVPEALSGPYVVPYGQWGPDDGL